MLKLKKDRILYKEKQMKNINDWIALVRTIEWDGKKYLSKLEKTFGCGNSYWIARTFSDLRNLVFELNKENIKHINSEEILNLDFLIKITKNKNNKIIENIIIQLPDLDSCFNYTSNTLRVIEFQNQILKELLYEYTMKLYHVLQANEYEYIIKYNKKENMYEIIYFNEYLKVSTYQECIHIHQVLTKEKLTGQDSLKIAEIMAY